jgi:iron complex transport system substrate-binding protein
MELVYMLDPAALAGLSFTYNGAPSAGEAYPPFVPANMTGLPVVGGWFGNQVGNFETFIGDRPDVIIDAQEDNAISLATLQQDFAPIPVVELTPTWADNVSTYGPTITFLGNLLGVAQQAQNLLNYYNNAMSYVQNVTSKIPTSQRATVYYAEGSNGLSTDPLGSMHTQLLAWCGGINVANVQLLPGYGMASVSPEQILQWNPNMIIIGRGSQASLYNTVMSNTTWSNINAVKNKQVFVRPDNPFSWFDGPPGPMQIVGLYWMVHTLYPTQTAGLNLSGEVQTFYTQFVHYQLNSTDVASLLAGGPGQ